MVKKQDLTPSNFIPIIGARNYFLRNYSIGEVNSQSLREYNEREESFSVALKSTLLNSHMKSLVKYTRRPKNLLSQKRIPRLLISQP